MPKAKPVSLHPLTFEQAIDALLKAPPMPKKTPPKQQRVTKRNPRKRVEKP